MFWYEDEVKYLESKIPRQAGQPYTVFYGSSSFRLWPDLYHDFEAMNPVNLGFGGSTLAACDWFFDRIVSPYTAKSIVVYAGDNDLGDGRHPEEIFIFFQQLVVKIHQRYGDIPCYFVSIKPSINRQALFDTIKYTNNIIENEIIKKDANWTFINIFPAMLNKEGKPDPVYFAADGLHLSPAGYACWKNIITAKISPIVHNSLT